jgi:hypothetical protein
VCLQYFSITVATHFSGIVIDNIKVNVLALPRPTFAHFLSCLQAAAHVQVNIHLFLSVVSDLHDDTVFPSQGFLTDHGERTYKRYVKMSFIFKACLQNCEKRLLLSACLSVHPHGTTLLQLDGFS